jgi:hypothetical protein
MARRKARRKTKRKIKRKVKRKTKRKIRRVKITPKKMKEFEKMETMYHTHHPSKTKKIIFGLMLLLIAALLFFNLFQWEYVLGLLGIFVVIKAFTREKCC